MWGMFDGKRWNEHVRARKFHFRKLLKWQLKMSIEKLPPTKFIVLL